MISFARPQSDNVEMYTVNIALFVGLALVFLIILLVMAPLATMATLNPPASTADPQPRPDKELYLTVKSDLTLVLGNDPVRRDELGYTLDAATGGDKDTPHPFTGGQRHRLDGRHKAFARGGLPQT